MNIYYVYQYLREDGTPYYVGKGKNYRAYNKNHYVPVPTDKSRIVFVATNLSECEAHDLEKLLIQQHGRKDLGTGILRNLTNGGEGTSGKSPETIEKLRQLKLGTKHSDEVKQKISVGNKGKTTSKYAKQKASETHKGKTLTDEHRKVLSEIRAHANANITDEQRQKLRDNAATARAVNQYTLDGVFVATHTQLKLAAQMVNLSTTAIRNACSGKWRQAGGFLWQYVK